MFQEDNVIVKKLETFGWIGEIGVDVVFGNEFGQVQARKLVVWELFVGFKDDLETE